MDQPTLISLQRSTAMLAPGSSATISRDDLLDLTTELLSTRSLLARLGGDLKTVARRAD